MSNLLLDIDYNSNTYNLSEPNKKISVNKCDNRYEISTLSEKKIMLTLYYDNISISSNDIHHIYVVLQYIMNKTTLLDLSKYEWDYSKWKFKISHNKDLPSWAIVLNFLLNLKEYNKPFNIKTLELNKKYPLPDARGWGGERPREQVYKKGFPLYTSATKKSLKNCERLFECPFPICRINPDRKAVVSDVSSTLKCFTCGVKEGEKDKFGKEVSFEKGHYDPHILGGAETAGNQCKWCNSFYKDKVIWNLDTGKPKFNSYAIMRDASKNEIIKNLKLLGFTPKDLE